MLKQNLQLMQIGSRHLIGVFSMINPVPVVVPFAQGLVKCVVMHGITAYRTIDEDPTEYVFSDNRRNMIAAIANDHHSSTLYWSIAA